MGIIGGLISGAVKGYGGVLSGRLAGQQALHERRRQDAEDEDRQMQRMVNLALLQGRLGEQQDEETGEAGAFDALHATDPQRYSTRIPGVSYRRIYEAGATTNQRTMPVPDENRAAYVRIPASAFPGGRKPPFSNSVDWVERETRYIDRQGQTQTRINVYTATPPRGGGRGDNGETLPGSVSPATTRTQDFWQQFASNLVAEHNGDATAAINEAADRTKHPDARRAWDSGALTRGMFSRAAQQQARRPLGGIDLSVYQNGPQP